MAKTNVYYGTGKRKTSVAKVKLVPGKGKITVNGKDVNEYLPYETLVMDLTQPLVATNTQEMFDVIVDVSFDDDNSTTETFLNREAITSTVYDGSRRNIHGYKYSDVLTPKFTIVKKDLDVFIEDNLAYGSVPKVNVNGLVYSDKYVSNPSEVVKVGQQVKVKVLDVDIKRKRIALTMKGLGK